MVHEALSETLPDTSLVLSLPPSGDVLVHLLLETTCPVLKYLCLGVSWWYDLITEPLGCVQDAQDVMVPFDEWLAVLGLCTVRVLDEPSAGRRLYVMTAWW